MIPFPQSIPSEAVNNLADKAAKTLRELREITEDFTKSFDDMSEVRKQAILLGMGKLNAYFDSLVYLGANGVAFAIMKMEACGVEDYINVLGKQITDAVKADPEMEKLKEICAKRSREWKEPKKPDLDAPANTTQDTAKAANG